MLCLPVSREVSYASGRREYALICSNSSIHGANTHAIAAGSSLRVFRVALIVPLRSVMASPIGDVQSWW